MIVVRISTPFPGFRITIEQGDRVALFDRADPPVQLEAWDVADSNGRVRPPLGGRTLAQVNLLAFAGQVLNAETGEYLTRVYAPVAQLDTTDDRAVFTLADVAQPPRAGR